ncbi:MAG: hypothetical protein R6U27_16125 [Desulfobacterales bacterium]
MKELENFLQNVAKGLRSLADVVDSLAEKSEEFKNFSCFEPETEEMAKAIKAKTGNGGGRRKIIRMEKPTTAAETVFQVIQAQKGGIDTSDLIKTTRFEEKKVRNIIYKLKKQNRIKAARRGVYVAS